MLLAIDPRDARSIFIQIADGIRRAIVLETLLPDAPLPSVRQLAEELHVNPNTVQQAYRELEREGTVYARQGQGTFVSPGGSGDAHRQGLARRVAERARVDADRHGVPLAALIDALQGLEAATGSPRAARASTRRGR
jgi:GntR family transcriptional regulator